MVQMMDEDELFTLAKDQLGSVAKGFLYCLPYKYAYWVLTPFRHVSG